MTTALTEALKVLGWTWNTRYQMLVQVQGQPELLSEFKTSLGSLWKLYLKMKM